MVCQELGVIANAVMSCSMENKLNSKCSIACKDGYELIGESMLTCLETREWNHPAPTCIRESQLMILFSC